MYCMWLAKTGNWNDLLSSFLEAPVKETETTAGSVMLDNLKQDFSKRRFRSELLFEMKDDISHQSISSRDTLGTSFLVRSNSDMSEELKRCDETDNIKIGRCESTLKSFDGEQDMIK